MNANKLQSILLDDLAAVRAALFNFNVPEDFARRWIRERLFAFKPERFTTPITPTRNFWRHVLESKIEATIRNAGDMIGWEDDKETVGPVALAAKESLLRAIPLILPEEDTSNSLYRFVLDHGDYGIHNASVAVGADGKPKVTSLFDWETGIIVPAILSYPEVAVAGVDLTTDNLGTPSVSRLPNVATENELREYAAWAHHYVQVSVCAWTTNRLEAPSDYCRSCRSCTVGPQRTRLLSKLERMFDTCGSPCETGEVAIRRSTSGSWGRGLKSESKIVRTEPGASYMANEFLDAHAFVCGS